MVNKLPQYIIMIEILLSENHVYIKIVRQVEHHLVTMDLSDLGRTMWLTKATQDQLRKDY